MRQVFFNLLFSIFSVSVLAQKLPIDTSVLDKLPIVGEHPKISNDGKYVMYPINFGSADHISLESELHLQAVRGRWKCKIVGSEICKASFVENSSLAVVMNNGDSLLLIRLGSDIVEAIPNVQSYQLPERNSNEWVAYRPKSNTNELVLRNLKTGDEQRFEAVESYSLNKDGKNLILQTVLKEKNDILRVLQWVIVV